MNTPRASASQPRPWREWLLDLSLLLALRAAATVVAVWLGFRAISDDDFARVTIAQSFALEPSFDPSGSSWLPFPFWMNGTAMLLLGRSFEVARGVSVFVSYGAVALAYLSGRWFSLSRLAAWVGAAIVAVLPHAVWLGYATVPEGYCGALCVFALASLAAEKPDAQRLLWGATALFAATLSRYETWAIAAVFALCCALRWRSRRTPLALLAAAIALLGPALWLSNGALRHGDAFFFVQRVAEYRQALGSSSSNWWSAVTNYPLVWLRAEPELMSVVFFALWKHNRALPRPLWTLAFGLSAMFLLLVLGDLKDGAPTHHAERPLLALWLGVALIAGHWLTVAYQTQRGRLLCWTLIAAVLFAARPVLTQREHFINRDAELEIGRQAKRLARRGVLVVDSEDLGFFASIAGFETPDRAVPLRKHDPRVHEIDPWSSSDALRQTMALHGGEWLIVGNSRLAGAADLGRAVAKTAHFTLLAVEGPQALQRP